MGIFSSSHNRFLIENSSICGSRQPFYGSVYGPGQGTGLLGAREMLRTKKGDELKALQDRLRGPVARLDAVFAAADTGQLDLAPWWSACVQS